jgi:hypothetical protein
LSVSELTQKTTTTLVILCPSFAAAGITLLLVWFLRRKSTKRLLESIRTRLASSPSETPAGEPLSSSPARGEQSQTIDYWEAYCESRCRDVVKLTALLADEIVNACLAIRTGMRHSSKGVSQGDATLALARIEGANRLAVQLIAFCERLNEEHEREFGHKVFPKIHDVLPEKGCVEAVLDEKTWK